MNQGSRETRQEGRYHTALRPEGSPKGTPFHGNHFVVQGGMIPPLLSRFARLQSGRCSLL